MKYFVFMKNGKCIGKAMTNYPPMLDLIMADPESQEVSQSIYDNTEV